MRRRIRSAAFPVHRHAVPQVVLDAGLVALSYFLAYRLRFDGGVPPRHQRELAELLGAPAFDVRGDHGAVIARAREFNAALMRALEHVQASAPAVTAAA